MAIETCQFRVVGVDKETGEDVSVVIEAATKAAVEVKAEKLNIDTTHIVRMKRADDFVNDEHTQYLLDAAEARSTTPTDKLIEEVVPPETPRETLTPAAKPAALTSHVPKPQHTHEEEPMVIAAISRPAYSAPTVKWSGSKPTGKSALIFVAAVLFGIAAGGYYVLVQQPMSASADEALLYGDNLFDTTNADIAVTPETTQPRPRPRLNNPDAFGGQRSGSNAGTPTTAAQPPSNNAAQNNSPEPDAQRIRLELQSVVVSHEGRFAVINGKLTPQGETVAGCTLVNVADDWVLMEHNGEQFILRIVPNAPAQ
ncbi:MAG: hypothetical protein AAGA29_09600 [Planctomycetota bacterium]